MKTIIADNKDNKRFTSIVADQFIQQYCENGSAPNIINFYRTCTFMKQEGDYYFYSYPESSKCIEVFKLYCPKKFIDKCLKLYKKYKNVFNEITDLIKEFDVFIEKGYEEMKYIPLESEAQ